MNILYLCEGDAEAWGSWSGISRSIVEQLRADGHDVTCGNVDLRGAGRLAGAAATFSPRRKRWVAKFHRSEEHTSELQSRLHLVCRLLLEKKKKITHLSH